MNQTDIIRMREQADDWTVQHLQCVGEYHPDFHTVSDERFAALVASQRDIGWHKIVHDECEAAIKEEREACAKVCEEFYTIEGVAQKCAAAIRAKGQA